MKVVITGPTGAIGMAMIQSCIRRQIQVLAICHKGSKRIKNIPSSPYVRVTEAELSDLNIVGQSINEKYDVFYHLAWSGTTGQARNNMYLQNENVKYTLDAVMLAKALGCHSFIGAGSQAEYGRMEGLLTSTTPTFPEIGYGMAKLCAGQMSRHLSGDLGIRHIWVRILSVYGPFDAESSMISSTLKKLLSGQSVEFTPAEQMWDYLYSEDAAEAMLLLADKGAGNKVYVLGSGRVRQLKDFIQEMYDITSEEYEATGDIKIGAKAYADKQVMYLGADISELRKDTGFEPEVGFGDGIRRTIEAICKDIPK